jgi:murein DD-endopeptidase MepM/ murein hydrolase activator NlpD
MALNPRLRVLLIFAAAFTMTSLAVWLINERRGLWRDEREQAAVTEIIAPENNLPLATPEPTVEATPEITPTPVIASDDAAPLFNSTPMPDAGDFSMPPAPATPTPFAVVTPESSAPNPSNNSALLIPVAGVRFEDLQNTFKDARSGGRVHDAIDIIAPRGTPVLACTDGRIAKLFRSERGGITLYQLSLDEKTVYYYAHLDRYRDGIAEGQTLRRGEVLGYVGDTGNATPGNYHLHFSVALIQNPRDIHNGTNLNPYELFANAK